MMDMIQCSRNKGHFYDKNKYSQCPECPSVDEERYVTVAGAVRNEAEEDDNKTVSRSGRSLREDVSRIQREQEDDMDVKTISYYETEEGVEPVVGWLVGISQKSYGMGFPLKAGRNFIGRGRDMDVVLQDDSKVSRNKHAIVVYEPRMNMFIAQPGETSGLFYVNGEVILSNRELKKNDVLNIGDTELMLIPCCDEKFRWEEM